MCTYGMGTLTIKVVGATCHVCWRFPSETSVFHAFPNFGERTNFGVLTIMEEVIAVAGKNWLQKF